jgi:hypothetical protein
LVYRREIRVYRLAIVRVAGSALTFCGHLPRAVGTWLTRSMSMNIWMELLMLFSGLLLLSLVGAVRIALLAIGFDLSQSTALYRSDYSREGN